MCKLVCTVDARHSKPVRVAMLLSDSLTVTTAHSHKDTVYNNTHTREGRKKETPSPHFHLTCCFPPSIVCRVVLFRFSFVVWECRTLVVLCRISHCSLRPLSTQTHTPTRTKRGEIIHIISTRREVGCTQWGVHSVRSEGVSIGSTFVGVRDFELGEMPGEERMVREVTLDHHPHSSF